MTSKLSIHWQIPGIPGWAHDFTAKAKPMYMKVMDPGTEDPFPECHTIVRTFVNNSESDYLVSMGAAGADIWVDDHLSYYMARPWAHAFEAPNEPSIWHPEILAAFPAFTQRFIYRMHDIGKRAVVGNINVGHWQPDQTDKIGQAIQGADYIATHEYGHLEGMWHEPDQTWLCLRYRRLAQWLGELGYQIPPWLITECGIDEIIGGVHKAWKDVPLTVEQYTEQLIWYEKELRKDDFVKGAFIFTATPTGEWMNFEVHEELAQHLSDELAKLSPVPPPPIERAKGFMATKYQTTLNWDLIAQEYDYVLLRVSGPNDYPDYTFTEIDPWLDRHVAAANAYGLPKAGFHYLLPDLTNQARVFAEGAARAEWELPLWTDVEEKGLTRDRIDGFNGSAIKRLAEQGVVYPELGIYTNLWLWQNLGPWNDMSLHLAQWGVAEPSISGWSHWQYGGGNIPNGEYTSLEVYSGTRAEMYEHYQIEEEQEDMWEEVGFADVELEGVTRERFNEFWGVNMKRYVPTDMPKGAVYYKLVKLSWRDGWCGLNLKVIDMDGNPIEGEQVFQGWKDGGDLPPNVAPVGGQPGTYPNKGGGGFTNANGDHGWGWGEGEWFDPTEVEGPHWYWRGGENGDYSDVCCGHGWWDEHEVLEPTYMRVIVDDGPTPPPPTGSYKVTGTIILDLTVEAVE